MAHVFQDMLGDTLVFGILKPEIPIQLLDEQAGPRSDGQDPPAGLPSCVRFGHRLMLRCVKESPSQHPSCASLWEPTDGIRTENRRTAIARLPHAFCL